MKHGKDFISSLETHAFPKLRRIKVQDITTADVLGVLTPMWTKTPETARRVRQRIGTVMKWAIAQGWRQDNPAENLDGALPKVPKVKAHMVALPYDKVAVFLAALAASEAMTSTKLALEFLILTAKRSIEVREARWSEIDLSAKVWVIPASRMKMKVEHRVPLSPRALEILQEAALLRGEARLPVAFSVGGAGSATESGSPTSPTRRSGADDAAQPHTSALIFPGRNVGRPLSDMTLSKLVKELGFPVDIHGFRTSFRTWAQERTHAAHEVAEAALAHRVGNSVSQAYARSDLFEKRRDLMNRWADYVSDSPTKVILDLHRFCSGLLRAILALKEIGYGSDTQR